MSGEVDLPTPTGDDAEEALEDEPKNILFALIRQLKVGMDLHRITFPTFVLEPRSMLERITDFMAHQDLVLDVLKTDDPLERFLIVIKYFMSGWHIKPKGVKKPYNPVIGEYFRCKWQIDGTTSYYISEQVSHHPPVSAYYFANPEKGIFTQGYVAPRSRFLGNSSAALMGGRSKLTFTSLPGEEYIITMPNIYAVGLFVGTMTYEIGDSCNVICEANDLKAEIDFKFKPMLGGSYNNIDGKIKRDGEKLFTLSGKWSEQIFIQEGKKSKDLFLDIAKISMIPKIVLPLEQQGEYESRRLWSKVSVGLLKRDQEIATDEKSKIEDAQRKLRQIREERNEEFKPNFFTLHENGSDWVFNWHKPDITAEELEKIIFEEVDRKAALSLPSLSLEENGSSFGQSNTSVGPL